MEKDSAKALVIVSHPRLESSIVNAKLLETLSDIPHVRTRHLEKLYPDYNIDVEAEQKAAENADLMLLQFPFQWYSCPPMLKKWLDDVLTYGWAYGSKGTALKGKHLKLAISTGGPEEAYQAGGVNHYSISELLKPFQQTANLCGMKYHPPLVLHAAPNMMVGYSEEDKERITAHVESYRALLSDLSWVK